jgi:hypothetical protein
MSVATAKLHHLVKLEELRGVNFTRQSFLEAHSLFPFIANPALQRLSIHLDPEYIYSNRYDRLREFLLKMSSLDSLELSFGKHCFKYFKGPYLLPQSHWYHLRSVSLQGKVTQQRPLQKFLESHAGTIRSLSLTSMMFLSPAPV